MLKSFLGNKDGNVAMMFGATVLFVLAFVGVAVDYNGMTKSRAQYQAMADAAVLMAASSGEEDPDKLQAIVDKVIAAHNINGETINAEITILEGNTLRVEVSSPQEMMIMGMFGTDTAMVRVGSEAPPKDESKINLALVLDVTDSMEGTKIDVLKTAAIDLVNELSGNEDDDDDDSEDGETMFSVVPFARYVQLPMSTATEPWLEITLEESCSTPVDWDNSTDCVDEDYTSTWVDDSGVTQSSENTRKVCSTYAYLPEVCSTEPWDGCVGSRTYPWNTRDYVGAHPMRGMAKGMWCDDELLPLTNDVSDVIDKIEDMDTDDKTYIPAGLIWGWRTLTDTAPFTEANTADKAERKQAMLLMSDGGNTRSLSTSYPGYHWDTDIDDANSVTETLCTNIKDDNIIVYTVAFEVTDPDTIALLRDCATDTAKFFDAGNTAALQTAFEDVGKDLAQIRLSK